MLWFAVLLLAVLQAITEFLPISSSGHLVVVQQFCKQRGWMLLSDPQMFTLDVALHVGSLLSILVYYRRRVLALLTSDRRVIGLLIAGSIPAGVAGFALKDFFEAMFQNPTAVGCLFFVTGAILLWADRRPPGETEYPAMSYWRAFVVGLAQAAAILPGVSRSGSTIAAGVGGGLRRHDAAAVSFLLAIPAIAGAGLKEGYDTLWKAGNYALLGGEFGMMLLVGTVVSFAVGVLALAWLVRWLEQGRLHWFAWWVFALGAATLGWQARSWNG